MAAVDRDSLLAAVERSPRAAAAHDRAAWVGLFTADGRIEDPVGSRPHVGHREIGRFYDTFIGPRDITFHRDLDIVCGTTVLRDLGLEVGMGSVTMHIPAFLRYDLRQDAPEANGPWHIAELRAYWELPAMMAQFLRTGARAVGPALQLSRGLLSNQRLRGTAGFMAGFRRAGARQRGVAAALLDAIVRGDADAAHALSPAGRVTVGDGDRLDTRGLAELLHGARATKTISSGRTVAASLESARGRGILFADLSSRGHTIDRIRYFPA